MLLLQRKMSGMKTAITAQTTSREQTRIAPDARRGHHGGRERGTQSGTYDEANGGDTSIMNNIGLKVSNLALYLATSALIGTGLLLELRMEEGKCVGSILGLCRKDWAETHFIIALAFIALGILHIVLNWHWFRHLASSGGKGSVAGGLLAGLALATGLLILPANEAAKCETCAAEEKPERVGKAPADTCRTQCERAKKEGGCPRVAP